MNLSMFFKGFFAGIFCSISVVMMVFVVNNHNKEPEESKISYYDIAFDENQEFKYPSPSCGFREVLTYENFKVFEVTCGNMREIVPSIVFYLTHLNSQDDRVSFEFVETIHLMEDVRRQEQVYSVIFKSK